MTEKTKESFGDPRDLDRTASMYRALNRVTDDLAPRKIGTLVKNRNTDVASKIEAYDKKLRVVILEGGSRWNIGIFWDNHYEYTAPEEGNVLRR